MANWTQGSRSAGLPLDLLKPPPSRSRSGLNCVALVDVLLNLRQPLDRAGETILTSEEAAKIRACGIEARAGKWYCPTLPHSIVGTLWALRHLSDQIDPYTRPVPWREKRATIRHVSTDPALSKFERRLIERLQNAPGQRLDRPALKRTFQRPGAWFVDRTIDQLIAGGHITDHGGSLYPFSRAELDVLIEARKRPHCPVPVSTIY